MDPQYRLLPRADFLRRLEPENPEALSVIEGLALPDWVLLLPMPADSLLRTAPERVLLRDYWARRFEGEVARAWQMGREDNRDLDRFGPGVLERLIGPVALAEAREVLLRDGVAGAGEGAAALCAAFVARVVRLRYFAPGTRGCRFPAVSDWRVLDAWLEESGLDLPDPLGGGRTPLLLERSRPGAACGLAAVRLPLPEDLPFGRSDPDLTALLASAASAGTTAGELPVRAGQGAGAASAPMSRRTPAAAAGPAPGGLAPPLHASALEALRQGAAIRRRRGLAARSVEWTLRSVRLLLDALRIARDTRATAASLPDALRLAARPILLRSAFAASQRAEHDGHYGSALSKLARTRGLYRTWLGPRDAGVEPAGAPEDPVEGFLEQHIWNAADSFASLLAARWKLSQSDADDLAELVLRLGESAGEGAHARTARAILRQLETALLEGRSTYYRLSLRAWLASGRARQVLPFQGGLKALRALGSARRLLDDLPWPPGELDRLAKPLDASISRIGERLARQLEPRIRGALEGAGFVPSGIEERIGLRRLRKSLTDLIRQRWHLKLSDLRDLLARDSLSLPDASLEDLWRGDRLARFDRLAARTLPGVYRRGEPYVEGLRRLSAPFFGTAPGRLALQVVLLPALAAWAAVELLGLVLGALPDLSGSALDSVRAGLASPEAVPLLALVISAGANTRLGRLLTRALWRGLGLLWRIPILQGLGRAFRRLLRFGPIAWLLARPSLRALWERILAPLGLGLAGLLPVGTLVFVGIPGETDGAAWIALLALAFALGIWLRDTPIGRRRMDDLASAWQGVRERLRHERLADLIAPIMAFFEEATRALGEVLHRIRTRLTPRLGEAPHRSAGKAVMAPLWGAAEAVIEFYAVVLVEPQTNPVKHFPVVTLGHKLMLPLLPALGAGLSGLLSPFLPSALALPLVAITLALLPGLFGFLFWELKENWRLYGANRRQAVPQARIGAHGETVYGLLHRGFHVGTLPKSFDRLRRALDRQVREGSPDPARLRRALARLGEVRDGLRRLAEQEIAAPLKERCGPDGGTGTGMGLGRVDTLTPEIATQRVVLAVRLHPAGAREPSDLVIALSLVETGVAAQVAVVGGPEGLTPGCRVQVEESLRWLLRRCGVPIGEGEPVPGLALGPPAAADREKSLVALPRLPAG